MPRGVKKRQREAWFKTIAPLYPLIRLNQKLKTPLIKELFAISLVPIESNVSTLDLTTLKNLLNHKRKIFKLWRGVVFWVLVRLRLPRLRNTRNSAIVRIKDFLTKLQALQYIAIIPRFFRAVLRIKRFLIKQIFKRRMFLLLAEAQWMRIEVLALKNHLINEYEKLLFARERRRPDEVFQHKRKMLKYRQSLFPANKRELAVVDAEFFKACAPPDLRTRILKTLGVIYRRKVAEENERFREKVKKFQMKVEDFSFLKKVFYFSKYPPQKPQAKVFPMRVSDAVMRRAIHVAREILAGENEMKTLGDFQAFLFGKDLHDWRNV